MPTSLATWRSDSATSEESSHEAERRVEDGAAGALLALALASPGGLGHVRHPSSVHMCPRSRPRVLDRGRASRREFQCTNVHSTFDSTFRKEALRWVSPPPSSAPGRSPRSPRRRASTATSSRSTRCGPPTRSGPASSTSTARSTSPAIRRSPRSPCSRPRPGRATAPASTSSSASRSTAPVVRRGSSRSPAPTPARGDRFTITLRANPDGVVSQVPGRARPARHDGPPLAGPGRVRAARPGARARAVHLRRLRHHPGDVDAALAAAPHPSRPGHLRALRPEPRAPDLRRRARRDPTLRPRHRPAPAAPRARRPEPVAGVPRAAGPRLPRRAHLGLRPGADDRGRAGGVRRLGAAARRVLPAAAHLRHLSRGRRRLREVRPGGAELRRHRCSSRPRRSGSSPSSAAGWASASPAPPSSATAPCATS